MKPPERKSHRAGRGFTLVELLVAVAIVLVLAALVAVVSMRAKQKAGAVVALNGLRQCGTAVFGSAAENGGSVTLFSGGNGHKEQRLISLVATTFGVDYRMNDAVYQMTQSVVYSPAVIPTFVDGYSSWHTYGVNIDDNKELGVVWKKEWEEDDRGTKGWVRRINPGTVGRAGSYPLIADSSNQKGVPRLRFGNDNEWKFAMRYGGKGPAIFLDGSARMVGESDLARHGIERAYLFENGPTSSPTLVTAAEGNES
jgi:prepilin-type N-terminal cleavage/methylation domain-containing protein